MSQANVEVVRRLTAAFNQRDDDRYLALCSQDIQLEGPWTAFEGLYEGPQAIRRFLTGVRDIVPDSYFTIERLDEIGADQVLAFLRAHATGRVSGMPIGPESLGPARSDAGIPITIVYDLSDGKIRRARVFMDRKEALEAAGLRE